MDEELRNYIQKRAEVIEKIKKEIIGRLNLYQTSDQIDDDASLFGIGLQLDSIDAAEIVVGLESAFGIEVKEGESLSYLRTINSMADFVTENIGK